MRFTHIQTYTHTKTPRYLIHTHRKPIEETNQEDEIEADFCGFNIPPAFVVGFGIDFNQVGDFIGLGPVICICSIFVMSSVSVSSTTKAERNSGKTRRAIARLRLNYVCTQ